MLAQGKKRQWGKLFIEFKLIAVILQSVFTGANMVTYKHFDNTIKKRTLYRFFKLFIKSN